MNFYNFVKTREKPIDIGRELWHNTDVADTDGKRSPVGQPLEGFPPEECKPRGLCP